MQDKAVIKYEGKSVTRNRTLVIGHDNGSNKSGSHNTASTICFHNFGSCTLVCFVTVDTLGGGKSVRPVEHRVFKMVGCNY